MVEEVKELRIKIDGLAQLCKELKPLYKNTEPVVYGGRNSGKYINPKEIEKAVDSLYLAKAWLGKVLAELGTSNPYGSGYKTKKDIVSTQEVAKNLTVDVDGGWQEINHIERVDYLRTKIQDLVEYVSKWYSHTQSPNREFSIARTNCYKYLCEARFWLGFEMQRIKEEK